MYTDNFRVMNTNDGSDDRKNMRNYYAAGYLPAYLGYSKYTSKEDVLNWYLHGIKKPFKSNPVIEAGFKQEVISREKLEARLDKTLAVCTGARDKYIAAFDGISLDRSVIFEHKLYSQAKVDAMGDNFNFDTNPLDFMQVVQQMYVSNADLCIYILADDRSLTKEGVEKYKEYRLLQSDVKDYYQLMKDTWSEVDKLKLNQNLI